MQALKTCNVAALSKPDGGGGPQTHLALLGAATVCAEKARMAGETPHQGSKGAKTFWRGCQKCC
eukprot:10395586-Lingulodinium_polyedra.AAC.1